MSAEKTSSSENNITIHFYFSGTNFDGTRNHDELISKRTYLDDNPYSAHFKGPGKLKEKNCSGNRFSKFFRKPYKKADGLISGYDDMEKNVNLAVDKFRTLLLEIYAKQKNVDEITLKLVGWSRGAITAIWFSNILYHLLKTNIIDTKEGDEKWIKNSELAKKLKQGDIKVRVELLALDPVAGPSNDPDKKDTGRKKNGIGLLNVISPRVSTAIFIFSIGDNRKMMLPIIPRIVDKTKTQCSVLFLPGGHSSVTKYQNSTSDKKEINNTTLMVEFVAKHFLSILPSFQNMNDEQKKMFRSVAMQLYHYENFYKNFSETDIKEKNPIRSNIFLTIQKTLNSNLCLSELFRQEINEPSFENSRDYNDLKKQPLKKIRFYPRGTIDIVKFIELSIMILSQENNPLFSSKIQKLTSFQEKKSRKEFEIYLKNNGDKFLNRAYQLYEWWEQLGKPENIENFVKEYYFKMDYDLFKTVAKDVLGDSTYRKNFGGFLQSIVNGHKKPTLKEIKKHAKKNPLGLTNKALKQFEKRLKELSQSGGMTAEPTIKGPGKTPQRI